MASESVDIDIVIQTAESAKNLGELKRGIADVRKALDTVEIGSKEFTKLNATLDDGAERLRTFRRGFDGIKAFESFGRTVTSSFGVASAAIAQFATDNDELQKSLNRVGAALTLVQSFSSLADAIKIAKEANLALNASLLTNPYVLVAAGIGAAILALTTFDEKVDESSQKIDELRQSALELVQAFSEEKFTQGVKDLNDELNRLKDSGASVSDLQAFLKKIDEEGNSGKLAVTFSDINIELNKLNESKVRIKDIAVDLAEGGTKFQDALKGSGLFAGQLTNELKKTKDPVKALENILKSINGDIATYNQLQEIQRKASNEILSIQKKQSEELSNQKQIITDYLFTYNQLVSDSSLYANGLQLLGASQQDINESNLSFLVQESDELNKQIPLIEEKIAKNKILSKDNSEYINQLKTAKEALKAIDLKIDFSDLAPGKLFENIFGTSADNAQKLLKTSFDDVLNPLRNQLVRFKEALNSDLTKSENVPFELPVMSGIDENGKEILVDYTQAVKDYANSIEIEIKQLNASLESLIKQQDLLSASIETSQNNITNVFTFFNSNSSIGANFVESFKIVSDSIENIVTSSGKRLSLIIGDNGKLAKENLSSIVKVARNFYDEYNKTLLSTKTNLDKLYKDGRISFEDYQQALKDASQSSINPLEKFETILQEIVNLTTDPDIKKAAQDLFKSFANGASGTIAKFNEVVQNQIPTLTDAQEKSRQNFDKVAGAIESRVGQLNSILQQASDQRIQILEDEKQRSLDVLQDQYDRGLISQQQYEEKSTLLDKEYKLKEKEEKKKAFAANKAAAIVQAVINTALAVSAALTLPPPASYVLAAISGVLGAAQIGIISAQPVPEYADGGFINGPGGGRDDSITAKLSNGEYVMNAKSTNAFRPLLDQLNYGFAGIASKVENGKPNTTSSAIERQLDQNIRVNLVYSDVQLAAKKTDDIKARVTY